MHLCVRECVHACVCVCEDEKDMTETGEEVGKATKVEGGGE